MDQLFTYKGYQPLLAAARINKNSAEAAASIFVKKTHSAPAGTIVPRTTTSFKGAVNHSCGQPW